MSWYWCLPQIYGKLLIKHIIRESLFVMVWERLRRVTGYLGAVVVCGGYVARNCLTAGVSEEMERSGDSEEISRRGLKLKHVQVFFRHGARTPAFLTPNIEEATYRADIHNRVLPHTDFKLTLKNLAGDTIEKSLNEMHNSKTLLRGGCVPGSLTTLGQQQMFELGQRLRSEYVGQGALLDPTFNKEHVYTRSTNINRTIVSARCVLAGMFGAHELINSGTASISISPQENEVLAPNSHICTLVRDINHAALFNFDNIPGLQQDRLRLEKILGVDSSTSGNKVHFMAVRDDMVSRQAHGLHIPEKLLSVQNMIEKNAHKIMYHSFCGQHQAELEVAVKMTAGPALTMAVKEMKACIQGSSQQRVCLYSVHDSLIIPLMVILGNYDGRWPPFAADICLELFADKHGEHWVRARYRGKVLNIRGCDGSFCKYTDFTKNISQFLVEPEDYKRTCTSDILKKIAKDQQVHDSKE